MLYLIERYRGCIFLSSTAEIADTPLDALTACTPGAIFSKMAYTAPDCLRAVNMSDQVVNVVSPLHGYEE